MRTHCPVIGCSRPSPSDRVHATDELPLTKRLTQLPGANGASIVGARRQASTDSDPPMRNVSSTQPSAKTTIPGTMSSARIFERMLDPLPLAQRPHDFLSRFGSLRSPLPGVVLSPPAIPSSSPVLSDITELPTISFHADSELVERARNGDRWAEEALYRRHVRAVTNAVTRLLGRVVDADDVIQETFVRAFERIHEVRDGVAFRAWVQRIAVTLCHSRFRRNKLMRMLGLDRGNDDATMDALASQGSRPDLSAELREIERTLQTLPLASRSAWILHRVEGWTLHETANALDISLATAKRRLAEADLRMSKLRDEDRGA